VAAFNTKPQGKVRRNMRLKPLALVFALILAHSLPALAQIRTGVTKIIAQADAPVEIREYGAYYYPASSSQYDRHPDQIVHKTKFLNKSGKKLMAVEFGLVEFDLFNEYLGRMHGLTADDLPLPTDTKPKSATWEHSPYASFGFLTGVAYVSQVRFEDGQIWKADLTNIVAELKKIEADFDATVLNKKKADDK
jgi:hypothetical protein